MAGEKTRVVLAVAAAVVQPQQEQMAVRTLAVMVVQGKQTTSPELMSRSPVAEVAVAIATPLELVELAAAEMEAVEVMRFQRQERMGLVAAVEQRAEVLPAALGLAAIAFSLSSPRPTASIV